MTFPVHLIRSILIPVSLGRVLKLALSFFYRYACISQFSESTGPCCISEDIPSSCILDFCECAPERSHINLTQTNKQTPPKPLNTQFSVFSQWVFIVHPWGAHATLWGLLREGRGCLAQGHFPLRNTYRLFSLFPPPLEPFSVSDVALLSPDGHSTFQKLC